MVTKWQDEISFVDRFQTWSEIRQALASAKPGYAAGQALDVAKSIEETAHSTRESKVGPITDAQLRRDCNNLTKSDYHTYISRYITSLQSEAQPPGIQDQGASGTSLTDHGIALGRYRNAIYHKEGSSSTVYKARYPVISSDTALHGDTVALKVTVPSRMSPPHDSKRECRLLHKARGSNVIELIESFSQSGGQFILVFPFLPCPLDETLRRCTLSPGQQHSIMRDMMSGLAHIHGCGIIHRDFKPGNIMMDSWPDGTAYIIDFGTAWSEDDPSSEPAGSKILDVGTTSYRPPELLFGGQKYDTSLDMWAAGCVAYEILHQPQDRSQKKPLFEAGDVGSELALIKSIFETLGTPNAEVWPESANMPDWGKMAFKEYPARSWQKLLPGGDASEQDFVSSMLKYESGQRMTAAEALRHPYLAGPTLQ